MYKYNKALKRAKEEDRNTFDFIEGVNVYEATLIGNAAKIEKKGTLMKGNYIKLEK